MGTLLNRFIEKRLVKYNYILLEPTKGKMIFAFALLSALVIFVQPLNSIPIDDDEVYELQESLDFEDDSYGLQPFAPFLELDDRDDVCNTYNGVGTKNGKVCCAKSCGTCGGKGCSKRPGGKKNCCARWIKKNCGTAPCKNQNGGSNTDTKTDTGKTDAKTNTDTGKTDTKTDTGKTKTNTDTNSG